MRPLRRFQRRVFAVNPCTRGFGFAVLEGPETLLDWGRKEVRNNKHTRSLQQINDLIEYYHPDVLVIEDYQDRSCRRCVRVRELIRDITALAGEKKVRTRSFSHREVKIAFSASGAITKYVGRLWNQEKNEKVGACSLRMFLISVKRSPKHTRA